MTTNYSEKSYNKETMARALGKSLPISFKQSIEICSLIRNKDVNYAKKVLNGAISLTTPIPFRRFNMNMGHKKNIMSGRYPKKTSTEILKLIDCVEANAQFKGLNTANLVITHINANKASKVTHFGRKRSRDAKRTNVEIVVREKAAGRNAEKKTEKKKTETKKKTLKEDKNKKQKND
ncbi:MAG: 50S ribosomal protein L22 [Candidatus Woesearchaeota archaeon]